VARDLVQVVAALQAHGVRFTLNERGHLVGNGPRPPEDVVADVKAIAGKLKIWTQARDAYLAAGRSEPDAERLAFLFANNGAGVSAMLRVPDRPLRNCSSRWRL